MGVTIFPKRHFIAVKNQIVECQLVESSYCRIVKLPKLYNAECYFPEWFFSRTLFCLIFYNYRFFNEFRVLTENFNGNFRNEWIFT